MESGLVKNDAIASPIVASGAPGMYNAKTISDIWTMSHTITKIGIVRPYDKVHRSGTGTL